jgi:hypothetical protein
MKRDHRGAVRHAKSLLPAPRIDFSAGELSGCDGTETLATEILTSHMGATETSRVEVDERIDITCPSWIAENYFIGQLLPHAVPEGISNAVVDTRSPAEVSPLIVAIEVEAYMQDLPDVWWFCESLHQEMLHSYSRVLYELECLKVETSTKLQVRGFLTVTFHLTVEI